MNYHFDERDIGGKNLPMLIKTNRTKLTHHHAELIRVQVRSMNILATQKSTASPNKSFNSTSLTEESQFRQME